MNDLGTLVFFLGLLLGVGTLLFARSACLTETSPPSSRDSRPALLLTLLSVLLADAYFRGGIVFLQGGDEYARAMYAINWWIDPYFAPPDHIWLAGQFYLLGGLMHIFPSMPAIVGLTGLVGLLAVTFFAFRLGVRLWNRPVAGTVAGVLTGTNWVMLWASINPHAELFFLPALLAGIERWVAGWQRRGGNLAGAERCFLQAAAWFGFGTMFRFEMWYVGIIYGCFMASRFLTIILTKDAPSRLAGYSLAGGLLLASYPMLWMASSAIHLGSPLAFVRDASQMNIDSNILYDFATPLARFLTYPRILIQDHWHALSLPAVAVLFVILRRRRLGFYLVGYLILILFAMVVTLKAGVGSNNRPRYTLYLLFPLIALGAGLPAILWECRAGASRTVIRGVVMAFVLVAAALSLKQGRESYPHAYGIPTEALVVFDRLERNWDMGRPHHLSRPIQEPEGDLFVLGEPGRGEYWWMAMYHSHWPRSVHPVWDEAGLRSVFETAPQGARILVLRPSPEWAFSGRAEHLESIGAFDLFAVR